MTNQNYQTVLSTCQEAKLPIEDLLLNIRTQPIGPHLSSPRDILLNRTEECPGRPSHPVDMENMCNYLISKKTTQKENHDKSHKVRTLPDIIPGQEVLFFSSPDPHQYIEGTITSCASAPRSYIIESQGRNYCCNCQHICPLHTPIPRPSTVEQPNVHTNSSILGPSVTVEQPNSHVNSNITGPSATTLPLSNVNTTI